MALSGEEVSKRNKEASYIEGSEGNPPRLSVVLLWPCLCVIFSGVLSRSASLSQRVQLCSFCFFFFLRVALLSLFLLPSLLQLVNFCFGSSCSFPLFLLSCSFPALPLFFLVPCFPPPPLDCVETWHTENQSLRGSL